MKPWFSVAGLLAVTLAFSAQAETGAFGKCSTLKAERSARIRKIGETRRSRPIAAYLDEIEKGVAQSSWLGAKVRGVRIRAADLSRFDGREKLSERDLDSYLWWAVDYRDVYTTARASQTAFTLELKLAGGGGEAPRFACKFTDRLFYLAGRFVADCRTVAENGSTKLRDLLARDPSGEIAGGTWRRKNLVSFELAYQPEMERQFADLLELQGKINRACPSGNSFLKLFTGAM